MVLNKEKYKWLHTIVRVLDANTCRAKYEYGHPTVSIFNSYIRVMYFFVGHYQPFLGYLSSESFQLIKRVKFNKRSILVDCLT